MNTWLTSQYLDAFAQCVIDTPAPLCSRKERWTKVSSFPSLLIFYEKLKMKIVLSVSCKKLAIIFKYRLTILLNVQRSLATLYKIYIIRWYRVIIYLSISTRRSKKSNPSKYCLRHSISPEKKYLRIQIFYRNNITDTRKSFPFTYPIWPNFHFVLVWQRIAALSSSDYIDFANNPVPQFRILSFAWFLASLPKVQADRVEILT